MWCEYLHLGKQLKLLGCPSSRSLIQIQKAISKTNIHIDLTLRLFKCTRHVHTHKYTQIKTVKSYWSFRWTMMMMRAEFVVMGVVLIFSAVFPSVMTDFPRCFHPQRSQQWSRSHFQGDTGGKPFHLHLHHRLHAPPKQKRSQVGCTVLPSELLSLKWFDRHSSS